MTIRYAWDEMTQQIKFRYVTTSQREVFTKCWEKHKKWVANSEEAAEPTDTIILLDRKTQAAAYFYQLEARATC